VGGSVGADLGEVKDDPSASDGISTMTALTTSASRQYPITQRATRYYPAVMRPFAIASALVAGTLYLYLRQVETIPPSLAKDEVWISMTAQTIATTGTDLMGRPWPLYIQMTAGSWFHPVIVYAIALVLQVLPLSEFAIRLPTVLAGVINVVLTYLIARVLFRREVPAVLAASLLALTPAHFLHSRFALEYLYPLPFILAWLFCLLTYLERGSPRWLFASTLILGVGFYSYIGSVLMMPVYLSLTVIALLLRTTPIRGFAIALAGFAVPLLALFVPWLIQHQAAFGHTVGHYLIYDTARLNPLQGARELLSHASVSARTATYWRFMDPSFLFLDLTAPFMYSTRTTGAFLLPLVLFLPVGLYHAFRNADPARVVVGLGFLTAPFAAVLVGEPNAIGRALELLPFGVLVAVIGIVHLWTGPRIPRRRVLCLSAGAIGLCVALGYMAWTLLTQGRSSASAPVLLVVSVGLAVAGLSSDQTAWRLAVAALLVGGVAQFQQYARDYFTDYPARAAEAFLFNRRGGFEYVIGQSAADTVPAIYLSQLDRDVESIRQHWRFYLIKHGREDLLSRTVILGESQTLDLATVPPNSTILGRIGDPAIATLLARGELTLEMPIPEPGGRPFYAVFRR
jgi:predicted membrane-bound mannosyltransferase